MAFYLRIASSNSAAKPVQLFWNLLALFPRGHHWTLNHEGPTTESLGRCLKHEMDSTIGHDSRPDPTSGVGTHSLPKQTKILDRSKGASWSDFPILILTTERSDNGGPMAGTVLPRGRRTAIMRMRRDNSNLWYQRNQLVNPRRERRLLPATQRRGSSSLGSGEKSP